jgi:hypothetical protein
LDDKLSRYEGLFHGFAFRIPTLSGANGGGGTGFSTARRARNSVRLLATANATATANGTSSGGAVSDGTSPVNGSDQMNGAGDSPNCDDAGTPDGSGGDGSDGSGGDGGGSGDNGDAGGGNPSASAVPEPGTFAFWSIATLFVVGMTRKPKKS